MAVVPRIAASLGLLVLSAAGVSPAAASSAASAGRPRPPVMERIEPAPRVPSGARSVGAVSASAVTYIPPVIALFIGYVAAGEPIGALDLAAMACILGGVYVLQTSARVKNVPPPAEFHRSAEIRD